MYQAHVPMATVRCQCTVLCDNYCIVAQGSRSRHRNRQWTTGDSFLSDNGRPRQLPVRQWTTGDSFLSDNGRPETASCQTMDDRRQLPVRQWTTGDSFLSDNGRPETASCQTMDDRRQLPVPIARPYYNTVYCDAFSLSWNN